MVKAKPFSCLESWWWWRWWSWWWRWGWWWRWPWWSHSRWAEGSCHGPSVHFCWPRSLRPSQSHRFRCLRTFRLSRAYSLSMIFHGIFKIWVLFYSFCPSSRGDLLKAVRRLTLRWKLQILSYFYSFQSFQSIFGLYMMKQYVVKLRKLFPQFYTGFFVFDVTPW